MSFSISVTQALDVAHDLYMALQGTNGYGGDTAEIYAYRLMPMSPGYIASGGKGKLMEEQAAKLERHAAEALFWMCHWFCAQNDCEIEIDGLLYGDWAEVNKRFAHRVQVRVIHGEKE